MGELSEELRYVRAQRLWGWTTFRVKALPRPTASTGSRFQEAEALHSSFLHGMTDGNWKQWNTWILVPTPNILSEDWNCLRIFISPESRMSKARTKNLIVKFVSTCFVYFNNDIPTSASLCKNRDFVRSSSTTIKFHSVDNTEFENCEKWGLKSRHYSSSFGSERRGNSLENMRLSGCVGSL